MWNYWAGTSARVPLPLVFGVLSRVRPLTVLVVTGECPACSDRAGDGVCVTRIGET